MVLSKSNYLLFLKHKAWLWLEKHDKGKLPPIDEDTQAVFDAGHLFEEYAEQMFPTGVKLGYTINDEFDWNLYKTLPERTQRKLDAGTKVIFQGRVEVDDTTCIFDVLERTGEGKFNLYEIKSSTSAKEEHEYDLAFQTYVLEKSGLEIENVFVVHVNKEYVRNGDIDPSELVDTTEITSAVRSHMALTARKVEEAKQVMNSSTMPDPSPSRARLGAFTEWLNIYRILTPDIPEHSIYDLTRVGARRVAELEEMGVSRIADIPEDFNVTVKQRHQIEATRRDERFVNKEEISAFLEKFKYPLYFLDYETFSGVIPPYDGVRPYQQIPFQYSLHILREPGGELEHREYLHQTNTLPVPKLVAQLKKDIGPEGSVIVWNKSFEMKCNADMAELAPEFNSFLYDVNDRIVDLMVPFKEDWFVDKDFLGSASIKKVLPVLVPELSYKELEVQGGSTAQRVWMQCVLDNKIDKSEEEVMNDLREYCKLDTLAMVKIWEVLRSVSTHV